MEIQEIYILQKSKEFEGYDVVTNKMYYDKLIEEHPEILKENEVKTVEELLLKKGLNPKDGYIPENHEGIMTTELIEVNYYYIRKAKIIIRHIDKVTGKLIEAETTLIGHEGDAYRRKNKTFEEYDLIKEEYPENAEGVIINGHEGDSYQTHSKTINGFTLKTDKLPNNQTGKMTKEDIIVIYYYENIPVKNEVESNSNNIINNGNNNNNSNNNNITPSTGDIVPVVALSVIVTVIFINILQIKLSAISIGKREKIKKRRGKHSL